MAPHRQPDSVSDYDTSLSLRARKYLRTYGLTPPVVEDFETQSKRCMSHFLLSAISLLRRGIGLQILHLKQTPLDKFQYLTWLKAANVHLFYRLLAGNIKVAPFIPFHVV